MTKNWKKLQLKKNTFFITKNYNLPYLSLGLHRERPGYKRNLQFSKENIQHFKTWNFLICFYFSWSFLPSWIRIRHPASYQTHNRIFVIKIKGWTFYTVPYITYVYLQYGCSAWRGWSCCACPRWWADRRVPRTAGCSTPRDGAPEHTPRPESRSTTFKKLYLCQSVVDPELFFSWICSNILT